MTHDESVGRRVEVRDSLQDALAIAQSKNTQVLEIFVRELGQDAGIHAVFREGIRVLRQTDFSQPITDLHLRCTTQTPEKTTLACDPDVALGNTFLGT